MKINDFSNLIDFFKANRPMKNSSNYRFDILVEDMKQLKYELRGGLETKTDRIKSFDILTSEYQTLKQTVYHARYDETKKLLNENSDEIFFSCFELMEHNYRENSHSNILKHLFHHKFWNLGKEFLSEFVFNVTNDRELADFILKANYEIHREFSTKTGRIDILIEDKKNNFVIVIENKLLASISIKEYNEDNTISKTQLHNYINYISAKYKEYKTCYILLSLEPETEIELGEFIQADYSLLLSILKSIETENNIANEYKALLKSITNYKYDKEWLIELSNNFKNNRHIGSLNTFELANKYFQ
jgi:Holliday junction resolvase-like predicted endonuclease